MPLLDDKALLEKNKKRIVKTRAQLEALEKFYNEYKYPSESMKIQVAESIGLTEKQVSGWFCHRRLKDKKLVNGENYATGKQDRSSGVIQDLGSGHRQDSCGSTKQGDDKNFDTREVESGRLTSKEFSAPDLTYEHWIHYAGNYNRTGDASSGSNSSLRNMPNHKNRGPSDAIISRYLIPKSPTDVSGIKTRSGPSGYLKVKRQVENAAITEVKEQLGEHYREHGPPLGVEFDPLPPGAFESSMQDPVEENYYTGEAGLPTSPEFSNVCRNPKFCRDSVELAEGSGRETHGVESRGEYVSRSRPVEAMIMDNRPSLQHYGEELREKRAGSWSRKYIDMDKRIAIEEKKRREYLNYGEKGFCREIIKDGKTYPNRKIMKENQGPQRIRGEFLQQLHPQTSSMVDNLPQTQAIRSGREMPSSFSEDEESAGTSSSVD